MAKKPRRRPTTRSATRATRWILGLSDKEAGKLFQTWLAGNRETGKWGAWDPEEIVVLNTMLYDMELWAHDSGVLE
jgi:hypothetical protein